MESYDFTRIPIDYFFFIGVQNAFLQKLLKGVCPLPQTTNKFNFLNKHIWDIKY